MVQSVKKIPPPTLPFVNNQSGLVEPIWYRFIRNFALESITGISGDGIVSNSAGTLTGRTITGTANRIEVSNGSGISANPTLDISATYVGQTSLTTVGTIAFGTWNGTTLAVGYGGTGLASYTQGDLIYASAASTLSKLAKDTNSTRYLSNQGTSNDPSWNQVNLTNGVTGALPIANGGSGVTALPTFRAYANTNQAIPTATWTKVTLDTETFDTNTNFDSATNYRFTPTIAGYYQVNAGLTVTFSVGDVTTDYLIAIYKNGTVYSQIEQHNAVASVDNAISISDVVQCDGSTDYIELYVYQAAGADRNLNGGSNQTWMSGGLIG